MTGSENRARTYLLLLLAAALLAALLVPTAPATAQEEPSTDVTLTLLHNNDGESALFERLVDGQPFAGIAPFATVAKDLQREGIGVGTTFR